MTVAMKSTSSIIWEATLAALLPLVGRRLQVTTLVDDYPVTAFGDVLHHVDVDHVQPSGVEVAELNFGDGAGYVLLRRDEHRGSAVDADGILRIEMTGWALELERELGSRWRHGRPALRSPIQNHRRPPRHRALIPRSFPRTRNNFLANPDAGTDVPPRRSDASRNS